MPPIISSLDSTADQGFASAQVDRGFMYAEGRGVPQDYVQAHKWMNLAASRQTGEEKQRSADRRDTLARLMSPAQVAAKPNASLASGTPRTRVSRECSHCIRCQPAVGWMTLPTLRFGSS